MERHCRRRNLLVASHGRARVLPGVLPDHLLDVEARSVERVAILVVVGRDQLAVLAPLDRDALTAQVVRDATRQTSVSADRQVAAIRLDRRTQATCTPSTSRPHCIA